MAKKVEEKTLEEMEGTDIREFLVNKEYRIWAEKNKGMVKDIEELCHLATRFQFMWGIPITFVIKKDV